MDRKYRGLFIGPLWVLALVATATTSVAGETVLAPDVVDPEFTDGRVCWQDSVFLTSAVNMTTGALAGSTVSVDIEAAPISVTLNGPEWIFPPQGSAECIGSAMNGGVVRYDETGGFVVPGTQEKGLMAHFSPRQHLDCPILRFMAIAPDRKFYLWDESSTEPDHLVPLPGDGRFYLRWLSCDEILFWEAPRYKLLRLGVVGVAPSVTEVASRDYAFGPSFPFDTALGQRLVFISEGTTADLHRDNGNGWQQHRQLTSPDPVYPYFFSPEVFMWQNRPWVLGYIARNRSYSRSKVFLYDINNDAWRIIGDNKTAYKDPEALVLDNGDLAVYYLIPGEGTTAYKIVKP